MEKTVIVVVFLAQYINTRTLFSTFMSDSMLLLSYRMCCLYVLAQYYFLIKCVYWWNDNAMVAFDHFNCIHSPHIYTHIAFLWILCECYFFFIDPVENEYTNFAWVLYSIQYYEYVPVHTKWFNNIKGHDQRKYIGTWKYYNRYNKFRVDRIQIMMFSMTEEQKRKKIGLCFCNDPKMVMICNGLVADWRCVMPLSQSTTCLEEKWEEFSFFHFFVKIWIWVAAALNGRHSVETFRT